MHNGSSVHIHRQAVLGWIRIYTADTIERMPNKPATPNRAIRVPDDVWVAALEKARAEGRTLTEVIVTYLRRYILTPPRKRDGDG